MQSDTPHRKDLLVEQLETLRQMSAVYQASRSSFVNRDLAAIQDHTSKLESLSGELRRLNRQIAATSSSPADRELQRDVITARTEVHQLNRVFAALVRRSLRSVTVLMNVMTNATGGHMSQSSFHAYV
jgi:hypothetical protein